MTGKTHKSIAVSFGAIGYLVYSFVAGEALGGIADRLAILAAVMLMSACFSLFPDFDRDWNSIATKNLVSHIVNIVIRCTGGKHRARHTHSIDIFLVVCGGSLYGAWKFCGMTSIVMIVAVALASGWASHLVADMMTSGGVYIVFWQRKPVALVPKELRRGTMMILTVLCVLGALVAWYFGRIDIAAMLGIFGIVLAIVGIRLGGMRFKTGDEWEGLFYKFTLLLNDITMLVAIASIVVENINILGK